jgi:2,4-didehydro-3-deoxy-L-rhamnonate hydrolase
LRLIRVGESGSESCGVWTSNESYVDVSDVVDEFDGTFFANDGIERLRKSIANRTPRALEGRRFGPPIGRPQQIVCIGLNYSDHAKETGQAIPDEPIVFNKAPNTLVGPNDVVRIPRGSTATDWEVELGVVIGSRCRYLTDEQAAAASIAGYVLVNDVSERDFQLNRGGQWVKGKSCETFNPCGPYLVTPDEVEDVLALRMWLDVNGRRRQTGSTATMLFSPTAIVHYLSQFMVLEPGDLINTGTPPGVGMGAKPPTFLQPGDLMELGIDGLGVQRLPVRAAD